MIGQIVAGDFSKVIMRIKAEEIVEIGQLVVVDQFILQVFDLVYASQISQNNLEMVAGLNLEEGGFSLLDQKFRNYQLALLKPVLTKNHGTCKQLPPFFEQVRALEKSDLSFITEPAQPLVLGQLRSGSRMLNFPVCLPGPLALAHHILIPASTGKGKSNLMSCILWNLTPQIYAGILVLDPHDEYYGRMGPGLKGQANTVYYTAVAPPPGACTLKINLELLRPSHFQGAIALSPPQQQCLYVYHKCFGNDWIAAIMEERRIEGVRFHEDTLAVVKRKLIHLLNLEMKDNQLSCTGIFDMHAGLTTVADICLALEQAKTVIIDTSMFSGAIEILIASILTHEIFSRYKYYKRTGELEQKPVVSIVLEEAPRVLGKRVLEQGSNIFETIAREGRKFKVGLIAITQLPSEIPKTILANMNTKIILGIEMGSERQAVIESASQDLSQDSRNIASLDIGEALVTSVFTKFAIPLKIPFFEEIAVKPKTVTPAFIGIG